MVIAEDYAKLALGTSGYMLWNARGIILHSLVQLLDRELDAADRIA